jgi:hypothetical protein
MLTTIFCEIDDFCKLYEKDFGKVLLKDGVQKRVRESRLVLSEIITILIYAKFSGYKNFKIFFYNQQEQLKKDFPNLVSYSRFVELQKYVQLPLFGYLRICLKKCTGHSYIDSTKLSVCRVQRRYSHKSLSCVARLSKTSTGWFYGCKLHLIATPTGEIIDFALTKGNIADNNHQLIFKLCRSIHGKLYGDKGYMLKKKYIDILRTKSVQIITSVRKNMKKSLPPATDMQNLKQRGCIESVINVLKTTFDLEHSRHRSFSGFLNNIFASLAAYFFKEQKPSVQIKGGRLSRADLPELKSLIFA